MNTMQKYRISVIHQNKFQKIWKYGKEFYRKMR